MMKKMIIGLIIGLMLGMSTNAFAAIGDKVQAVFAEFNYVVDGNGKALDSPVLVYEGTSYVRTTQIANLLGFDVTYKADSRTIEFNNPKPTTITTNTPIPKVDQTSTPTPASAGTTSTPAPKVETAETPAQALNTTPSATPEVTPSPTPVPTATPKPDNSYQCQIIRDNNVLALAQFDRTHNPFSGGTEFLRNQLLAQQSTALSSAGCN